MKKGANFILLEKKIKKAIKTVNKVMTAEKTRFSDQGKDAMRNVLKGCTSFENTFDEIIEAGKKQVDEEQPKGGKKEKATTLQCRLIKDFALEI